MPVNKYIPKNIRKLYLIVCAYYTWQSIKTQVCQQVSILIFHFGANCVEVVFQKQISLKRSEWTSSHHRKMMFEGDWGCCPNEQFSKKHPKAILRKWVNLYRFALLANLWKGKISVRIIFDLGIITLCHLWPIRPQAEILFLLFGTCAQLGYKWFLKYLFPDLFPIWEQVKYQTPHLSPNWREVTSCNRCTRTETIIAIINVCPNWAEVFFIPDELSGILLSDKLSGSCSATSDQLGPKWYEETQIGKQGKVVPLCSFYRFPSGTIYAKLLARANIPVTLRTISVILAARVFNRFRKRTSSKIETKSSS